MFVQPTIILHISFTEESGRFVAGGIGGKELHMVAVGDGPAVERP